MDTCRSSKPEYSDRYREDALILLRKGLCMIWFSSDFHFAHKNIVRGTSKWGSTEKCRDFDTPEEMNECILNNLNKLISPEDTLYFLGDFAFSGIANSFIYREKINCKNIHFICGNHDNRHGSTWNPSYNNTRVSSLFSSYQTYKEVYINKTLFVLFHYPINSWNSMSKGAIHLHGHCHSDSANKFFNGGKSMDIGVDGNDYMPYSLDQITEIMNNKPIKKEGHH